MISRIKWINNPFLSNDCWLFGMSIMRALKIHYRCKSQVQHSLLFGLTSYAICLCPQTYSITATLFLSLVPSCAMVLTRALPLPLELLGGILQLSTIRIICFWLFIYKNAIDYCIWILQPAILLNLLFLQFFFLVSFFGSSQCLPT